jgi:hypothetical protein
MLQSMNLKTIAPNAGALLSGRYGGEPHQQAAE